MYSTNRLRCQRMNRLQPTVAMGVLDCPHRGQLSCGCRHDLECRRITRPFRLESTRPAGDVVLVEAERTKNAFT